jgi:regulatory protein
MDQNKCLSRLQKLCSKAEYCTSDIRRKALKDLEGDEEAAARVVASLVQDRYVDDARYASAFAREKAQIQGWGPVKIRFQLRAKGVKDSVITEALQEVEPQRAQDKLEKVLQVKAKALQGDPQFKLKLLKFGLGRGYDYDEVENAVSKIIATFAATK